MKNNSIYKILISFCIVAALILGGILVFNLSSKTITNSNPSKLSVTVSFYPLYFLTSQIGGDLVQVNNITPAGSEPHDYEPTSNQIKDIYQSKLFIFNGADLDPWAAKIQSDLEKNNVTAVEITKNLEVLKPLEEEYKSLNSEEEAAQFDPHLWLDPILAIRQAQIITQNLVKADPANKAVYEQNSAQLINKLNQLDQDFKQGLSKCEKNEIITSHNFMQYVAIRYGFKSIPISGISPDSEPSSQDLSQIAKLVQQKGLKYIFTESLGSPKLSQTVAAETGAQTLVLNPIEGLSQDELNKGQDYLTIQRQNLDNLKIALQCSL
ncbi:MAG: zinc ABC transporter substrate-binding protein [bacterium]